MIRLKLSLTLFQFFVFVNFTEQVKILCNKAYRILWYVIPWGQISFFRWGGTVHWIIYCMKFNKLNKLKESI